jgi:hypothetical protein
LTLIVTKRKGPLDIPNCRSSGPLFFSLHDYKILHYLVKKEEEEPARKKREDEEEEENPAGDDARYFFPGRRSKELRANMHTADNLYNTDGFFPFYSLLPRLFLYYFFDVVVNFECP